MRYTEMHTDTHAHIHTTVLRPSQPTCVSWHP